MEERTNGKDDFSLYLLIYTFIYYSLLSILTPFIDCCLRDPPEPKVPKKKKYRIASCFFFQIVRICAVSFYYNLKNGSIFFFFFLRINMIWYHMIYDMKWHDMIWYISPTIAQSNHMYSHFTVGTHWCHWSNCPQLPHRAHWCCRSPPGCQLGLHMQDTASHLLKYWELETCKRRK